MTYEIPTHMAYRPLKKTSMMRMVERTHGRPWDEVFRETLASGITRTEAASRLGVSVETLKSWELFLAEQPCQSAGCQR
jgi:hypothetical protein